MNVLVHRYDKPVGKGSKMIETIVGTISQNPKDKPEAIVAALNKSNRFKVGKVEIAQNVKVYSSVADIAAEIEESKKQEAEEKKAQLSKKLSRFTEDELKTFAEAGGGDYATLKALAAGAPKRKNKKKDQTADKSAEQPEPAAATA